MPTFNLGYKAASKEAIVTMQPDALPGGTTNLGTFSHDSTHPDALFHHVRDALYKRKANGSAGFFPDNITDMAGLKIVKHGTLANLELLTAAAISVEAAKTAAIVIKGWPANAAIANSAFTFTSSDATKATVAADGTVTGVAAGKATITAKLKNGGNEVKIPVTVTPSA